MAGTLQGMTRAHKNINLIGRSPTVLRFVAAIVLLWNQIVDWSDLIVLSIMYVLAGLGVTIGFHRLLTHRSLQTYKPVEYLFATLGSMAVQGPVISWVAGHRKHHAHTDEEGDPHSPHVYPAEPPRSSGHSSSDDGCTPPRGTRRRMRSIRCDVLVNDD